MRSPDEKVGYSRGYNKGYSTGRARSDDALAAQRTRANLAALRAERLEREHRIGHCVECKHWLRGGGGPSSSACAWGVCQVGDAAGTPWGTWARGDDGKKITTSPHFGCVLFLKAAP